MPARTPQQQTGARGEDLARDYLVRAGYRILARNVRTRGGEIDLVAEDRGTLVFVEVKTRTGDRFGDGLEALTPAKRRRLLRTAQLYLLETGSGDRAIRFDTLGVLLAPDTQPIFRLVRHAFIQ